MIEETLTYDSQLIEGMTTPEQFWVFADATKLKEKYRVDKHLTYLKTASLDYLKKVLVQYRYFTIYYIEDLALLISKLPFGKLKSVLAEILYEELGNGNDMQAHPTLYDHFLMSIGVTQEEFLYQDPGCINLLKDIQEAVKAGSWIEGVGLRGMGGECLCQLYLSAMYDAISANPIIQNIQTEIDWTFWEIHIGEVDLHHQFLMHETLNKLITDQLELIPILLKSYQRSQIAWDQFWLNIYHSAAEGEI